MSKSRNVSKDTDHQLYFNEDGNEVPSVTTVLKMINKPALMPWSNWLGMRGISYNKYMKESSTIGTKFHDAMEAYFNNKPYYPEYSSQEEEDKFNLFINNFLSWRDGKVLKPKYLEKSLVGEYYGGTIDFFGEIDGKNTLLDFKTGKKVYVTMFLQLAAYTTLLEEMDERVDQVAILAVGNPSGAQYMIIQRDELQSYIVTFTKLAKFHSNWIYLCERDGWGIE